MRSTALLAALTVPDTEPLWLSFCGLFTRCAHFAVPSGSPRPVLCACVSFIFPVFHVCVKSYSACLFLSFSLSMMPWVCLYRHKRQTSILFYSRVLFHCTRTCTHTHLSLFICPHSSPPASFRIDPRPLEVWCAVACRAG